MHTDNLFYQLFRRWPALALDLAGLDPSAAGYVFRSEELKQTAFRVDGILAPPAASDAPWVFVEVQYQPDPTLYQRLFAEIALFLRHADPPREWRALVLYPDLGVERILTGYASFVAMPEIHRIDLSQLRGQDRPTPGWDLLRLILTDATTVVSQAQALLRTHANHPDRPHLLDFIETVLVYQLPRCSREELRTMLGITDVDLKQTRFYQDVLAEGEQAGLQQGLSQGEALMLRRLLARRFGPLPGWAEQRLNQATASQLEHWADQLLEVSSLDALFADSEPQRATATGLPAKS